jgi:ABC-type dipeptide/oligopeptide/nickel transport system permease subunit
MEIREISTMAEQPAQPRGSLLLQPDVRWLLIWLGGLAVLWIWDGLFLNRPALIQLQLACLHSALAAALVVVFSLILGWSGGVTLYFLEQRRHRGLYLLMTFVMNILRSVPQMIGLLIGYVVLTLAIRNGTLQDPGMQIVWMAFVLSLFQFIELVDVILERIAYHRTLDFVPAMLCCGISENRIVNREILWKNSFAHLLHKLISIFGAAIFLQCSIDFIISVGLSTDVSLSNFPVTLGSFLATMESKQDILAISSVFTDFGYVRELFFQNLQGISVAFVIIFSLLCLYRIANGLVRRYSL